MWTAPIVGLLAVLLGELLGQFLSAVREHAEWVNEQKRLEYRQLIDQLFETMSIVIEGRPNLREQNLPEINQAVRNLHRVLLDRLFIVEVEEGWCRRGFLHPKEGDLLRTGATVRYSQRTPVLSRHSYPLRNFRRKLGFLLRSEGIRHIWTS